MCGIGGILRVWPAGERDRALATPHVHSIPEPWLDILDDSIKHRGPDGLGRFRDRAVRADGCVVDVAFVHRRLSIIDHAGGHQPMLSLGRGQGVVTGVKRFALGDGLGLYERNAASELGALSASEGHQRTPSVSERAAPSDRVCVIFNGCIYNHRELRAELQKAGHVFSTDHSDTEVLVHGWREWGADLPKRLEGMWALAIWDAEHAYLSVSRDRCGEKPAFDSSTRDGQYTAFGSTAAAVLCAMKACAVDEALAPGDWATWLRFGCFSRPPTNWIREVQPGELRVAQPTGKSGVASFIDSDDLSLLPNRQNQQNLNSYDLDRLLRQSVASRLESDVALGVFLSGGIDSSLMCKYAIDVVKNVRSFSVRMPDSAYDESEYAAAVAKTLGSVHTTLACDTRPAEHLLLLIQQMGVPLGDSSLLPSYWVSKAAKAFVTVAIGGDGGDELFGGYERYRGSQVLNRFHSLLAMIPSAALSRGNPRSRISKISRLALAARGAGYEDLLAIFPTQEFLACVPGSRVHGFKPKHDPLRDDFCLYLPGDLLRKTDSASMACALELRSPMLSRSIVDAALSEPLSSLMPNGQRKGLLRQVARKYLPADIVDRPKMGFAIPIGEWFRSDYGGLRTMLLDHLNSAEPFGSPSLGIDLNMKFVRQMLDEHLGTGPSGRVVRDHSQRLYMLLVLSIWAKWLSGLSRGA